MLNFAGRCFERKLYYKSKLLVSFNLHTLLPNLPFPYNHPQLKLPLWCSGIIFKNKQSLQPFQQQQQRQYVQNGQTFFIKWTCGGGQEQKKQQKNLIDKVLKNIALSTNVAEAVSKADLVIEAIVENVEVKQNLLDRVENAVKSGTILATNTSSLKLADIAANLKHKELFDGLHFFNPVPVMELLEVFTFLVKWFRSWF
uniref:3-hydroxyacyl-CoA dehydrogenase NAD binding domain-containing protein n=1 Tax=Meloidogyne incognita TaxID=6306 RepID=A0A914LZK1_MELIC